MNIEHEYLPVQFSLETFHSYNYGRHVMVQNDHKPLEMIQQKPIYVVPPPTTAYASAYAEVLTNHLSALLSHINPFPIPIAQNVQHVQLSNMELDIIWGSIGWDPMYSIIYRLILRGWPEHREQVPQITRHFWGAWDELSVNSGLFLKGTRVCIPPELLNCTLADLARSTSRDQ